MNWLFFGFFFSLYRVPNKVGEGFWGKKKKPKDSISALAQKDSIIALAQKDVIE